MTTEIENLQQEPIKTLEKFERMMILVNQFPAKKLRILSASTAGKWEVYPKRISTLHPKK